MVMNDDAVGFVDVLLVQEVLKLVDPLGASGPREGRAAPVAERRTLVAGHTGHVGDEAVTADPQSAVGAGNQHRCAALQTLFGDARSRAPRTRLPKLETGRLAVPPSTDGSPSV